MFKKNAVYKNQLIGPSKHWFLQGDKAGGQKLDGQGDLCMICNIIRLQTFTLDKVKSKYRSKVKFKSVSYQDIHYSGVERVLVQIWI